MHFNTGGIPDECFFRTYNLRHIGIRLNSSRAVTLLFPDKRLYPKGELLLANQWEVSSTKFN